MPVAIDINADLGEGMDDGALLPFVTSANVACGFHAGDPSTMDATVEQALRNGVHVGAHPGHADRENFGRIPVELAADEVERMVLYQIGSLEGFVRSRGARLSHVKPHGALYHQANEFPDFARAIVQAVRRFDASLILVGAPGSLLLEAGREAGLPVAGEGFADRRYRPDGTLVSRKEPGALLTDPEEAAGQAVHLARDGWAIASDGSRVSIRPDTLAAEGIAVAPLARA
jgi:5-oxoprolinase (ATP-hydrolysing) subunit A